jgi:ABC-type Fe3+ transport system permease subunit
MTGAGLAGASLLGAAGCGGSGSSYSPSADMWKQFSGTTLNFVSENTAPTTAIAANLNGFKELTGINVNVLQLELGALVQKVALDIGSGEGAYQVQYVIEAAKVDGANYLERLRYIVAPSIAGVVIVALLVRSMDAIRYFDIITVTTNGGPGNTTKIIPIRLYETAFRFFDLGYAAAIGLGMLVFSILVANVFVRILESRGLAR